MSTVDSVQPTPKVQPMLKVLVKALPTAVPKRMSKVVAKANVEVKYADARPAADKRKFVDLAVADTKRKKATPESAVGATPSTTGLPTVFSNHAANHQPPAPPCWQ